jgi:valyl-tRNA synthetase
MGTELGQLYESKTIEREIYDLWDKAGSFEAEPADPANTYAIVIPPPNVTDRLHVGHALNNTIQDILIRYHRMRQETTLWVPGTDHAGIATQTVVEKRILAEEGKRRSDFTRSDFVARIQAWKDEYEATILEQLQKMGCSCDWRRVRFTLDDMCARAVRTTFFKLFADGLIFRGKRLVNWDPATQTVLADDEVEHQEVHGHFWYLRYPLVTPIEIDGEQIEHVTVATTRPETMLGDTAVAMNPSDPRANALVGCDIRLPLVGRIIPIIADEHVVLPDPESDDDKARFSTGFLKVTPAHDPDDYQIGLRHDLEQVNVMAPDGTINDRYGWNDAAGSDAEQLLGMDRFVARKAVVKWFERENLLAEVRDYVHEVGHSYRSHVPIEPYLSDQWYVGVKMPIPGREAEGCVEDTDLPAASLAGIALEPLLDGRLRFVPGRYAATYRNWLENLRDWPISRQLWWGHRIPIWTLSLTVTDDIGTQPQEAPDLAPALRAALDSAAGGDVLARLDALPGRYVLRCTPHPEEENLVHAHVCLEESHDETLAFLADAGFEQDPDVLDTWFSSALWPFSTMGWPEKTDELASFYPGNVLCTAREIITLWVTKMVMMGRYCVNEMPFADVFIHAMIQDGDGRKMSKSLGNGIDPLVVIDSHGADAMRFTLASMVTQTQDVRMPVEPLELPDGRTVNMSPKFTIGRNFCNKLWNSGRFILSNLEGAPAWADVDTFAHLADRWVLSVNARLVRAVTESVEQYRFNEMADRIYQVHWADNCDWYLEIAKARINAGETAPKVILAHIADTILRLLHPITPFVTEALWQRLNEILPARGPDGETASSLLITAEWPSTVEDFIDEDAERDFAVIQDVTREIRNIRAQHNVPMSKQLDVVVEAEGDAAATIDLGADIVSALAKLSSLTVATSAPDDMSAAATAAVAGVKVHVLGVVDKDAELARLSKQKEKLVKTVRGIEGKLGNEQFVAKAPEAVVERERERLAGFAEELAAVEKLLEAL